MKYDTIHFVPSKNLSEFNWFNIADKDVLLPELSSSVLRLMAVNYKINYILYIKYVRFWLDPV